MQKHRWCSDTSVVFFSRCTFEKICNVYSFFSGISYESSELPTDSTCAASRASLQAKDTKLLSVVELPLFYMKNDSSSDSWLVEVLGGLLSGAEVASIGVTLHEHDVLTLEDAKDLRFDDLKEMGFSVGMRNKLIKAFDAASASPTRLGVGAVCTVSGLAQRGDLNGKKARVVGHDAPKGLWHVTVDGESAKIALRSKNLKVLVAAPDEPAAALVAPSAAPSAPGAPATPAAPAAVPKLALCCHPFCSSDNVSVMHPKQGSEPAILWLTGLLTFFAGLINMVGLELWNKSIGNVTGEVTKISLDLANVSGEFVELFFQFWAFVFGSLLSGLLVTGRKAPKKFNSVSDRPVRRASIVLIMVGIFLFIGWAATKAGGWKDDDNTIKFAPAMLAIAMGMQNAMTSKHAHAVIRTTHMTGVATDIGLLLGNILRREFMLKYEEKFEMKEIAPDRLAAVRKLTNFELEFLRLLFVLLLAFFTGGVVGKEMYDFCGIDTLLFPAMVELGMGVGYLYWRTAVSKEGSRLMSEPQGFFQALKAKFRKKGLLVEMKGAEAL